MQKLTDDTILCKCGKLLEAPKKEKVVCDHCGVRWGWILAEMGKPHPQQIKKEPINPCCDLSEETGHHEPDCMKHHSNWGGQK